MSGRAQADNGPSPVQVIDKVLHLLVGPVLEAGEDHHEICRLKSLQARDIGMPRDNLPLVVHSEEDGTFEPMMPGQDPREGGKSFLRFVLMVTGDKDEVLALPRSPGTFIHEWTG